MTTLKIGDRVEIAQSFGPWSGLRVIVSTISNTPGRCIRVRHTKPVEGSIISHWHRKDLRLLSDTPPAFKVGDRVEITCGGLFCGKRAVAVTVEPTRGSCTVTIDGRPDDGPFFFACGEFKKISEIEATKLNTNPKENETMKLSKVVKDNMPEDQVAIMEAFMGPNDQVWPDTPEFGRWWFMKFGKDSKTVSLAKEILAEKEEAEVETE